VFVLYDLAASSLFMISSTLNSCKVCVWDRGKQSLESICLLLAFKIRNPDKIFLIRGNHECCQVNRMYGFFDECKRRFTIKLWKFFNDTFNYLPVSALIEKRILCMHGGLSPDLHTINEINLLMRPTEVPEKGLLCDLLWSDPDKDASGWGPNDRGISVTFSASIVETFLKKHEIDLVCRAHQVVDDGYEFFANRHLVTLFSAPNYCGDYDNFGAMMSVDEKLTCSFQILKPTHKYGNSVANRPVTPIKEKKNIWINIFIIIV